MRNTACAMLMALLAGVAFGVGDRGLAQETTSNAVLAGHTGPVCCVQFSHDSKLLASASEDQSVRLWNIATGKQKLAMTGHTGSVSSVAFTPDDRMLVSGSFDSTIKLWEVASGRCRGTMNGHTKPVNSVAINRAGTLLASGSQDCTVKLWDLHKATEVATLKGHKNSVLALAFASDGLKLISAGGFREFGTMIGDRYEMKVWDTATAKEQSELKFDKGGGRVSDIVLSIDGKALVAAREWQVQALDLANGKTTTLRADRTDVYAVAMSPNAKWLAWGGDDETITLWEVGQGKEAGRFVGHTGTVWSVAFSGDGKWLASGSADGTVRLWDVVAPKKPAK